MAGGILSGLRVLDFGRYIAGPYCAALLADLGAEVIRIENPGGNDDRYVMPVTEKGEGALYIQMNRNKKSLALDVAAPDANEVIQRLVRSADVVVVNLSPKARARLGLDYETLSALKPNIVLTTVTAYGTAGPDAESIGFDGTGQALSGGIFLTGVEGQPYRSAISYVDYATAIASALGTLAALMRRAQTGKGEHVETSLLNTALTMTNPMLIEEASGARSRKPTGNRTPIAAPSDIFRTKDGWLLVQVIGQSMFKRWTRLVGEENLYDDPRFADDISRGENGPILSERMNAWTAQYTTDECLERLRNARVPGCRILSPGEALRHPQNVEGDFFDWISYPGLSGPVPLLGALFSFSGLADAAPNPAPQLGAETRSLLEELGYTAAEVDGMVTSGLAAAANL